MDMIGDIILPGVARFMLLSQGTKDWQEEFITQGKMRALHTRRLYFYAHGSPAKSASGQQIISNHCRLSILADLRAHDFSCRYGRSAVIASI
jgi:hypothetical protein